MVLCAVLLAVIAATPAHAITNLYALQEKIAAPGGTLLQYAVGAGGALSPLSPSALGACPRDIAVTPDGRFAYVMTSDAEAGATIITFARGANGRLEQTGAVGPMDASARGIVVDPQGRRIYYGHPADAIFFRDINADGSLGAERSFPIGNTSTSLTGYAQYLAMTPDGRNLYAAQYVGRKGLRVWQSTIDPATGVGTPKDPSSVAFPAAADGPEPAAAGRLAITPSGGHLYAAADTAGVGIGRWAIDSATGSLTGGTLEAPPAHGDAEAAVALSADGSALWAPSAAGAGSSALWAPSAAGAGSSAGRIRQFSVGAGGALAPLAT